MAVYGRLVYPRFTMKNIIIVVCKFVTFSLLKLGWNTEVEHSKQLARIANLSCFLLIFFFRRREQRDKTEGGPIGRNWKQGLLSKQIIIYNEK